MSSAISLISYISDLFATPQLDTTQLDPTRPSPTQPSPAQPSPAQPSPVQPLPPYISSSPSRNPNLSFLLASPMASICFSSPLPVLCSGSNKNLLPHSTLSPQNRSASNRRPSSRVRRKHPIVTSSTEVPTHFSLNWYTQSNSLVDVDFASHYIPNPEQNAVQTDFHFIDSKRRIMAVIDYPVPSSSTLSNADDTAPGQQVIQFIQDTVGQTQSAFSTFPTFDLAHILSTAADRFSLPPYFSAVLIDASTNVLRMASVGSCAVVVVRDDRIVYCSYPSTAASMIEYIPCSNDRSQSQTPYLPLSQVHTDFIELQPNDLILAGTDGLFANLTDSQILAFVRPVPDPNDKTLAIANNTCLGSWTTDDVDFISYYLAILATNFATAINSRPVVRYPFPPSPHLDDVTVLCAACLFSS